MYAANQLTRIQRAAIQNVRRDTDARIVIKPGAGAQDCAAILGEANATPIRGARLRYEVGQISPADELMIPGDGIVNVDRRTCDGRRAELPTQSHHYRKRGGNAPGIKSPQGVLREYRVVSSLGIGVYPEVPGIGEVVGAVGDHSHGVGGIAAIRAYSV